MEVGHALRRAAAVLCALAAVLLGCPRAQACESQNPCGNAGIGALASLGLTHTLDQGDGLVRATAKPSRAPLVVVPAKAPLKSPDHVEMPWIWQALKKTAYDRLPQKDFEGGIDCTFAPTIVSTGFDTVAGAGLEGRF